MYLAAFIEWQTGVVAAETVFLTEFSIHLALYRKVFVDLYRAAVASGSIRNRPRSRRPKTASHSRPGEHVK